MSSLPEHLFDTRNIERYLKEGRISQADYQAYLDGLEDSSANMDESHIRMTSLSRRRGDALTEFSHEEEEN